MLLPSLFSNEETEAQANRTAGSPLKGAEDKEKDKAGRSAFGAAPDHPVARQARQRGTICTKLEGF